MKILLANDTSCNYNPGCKGTIAGLKFLFEESEHCIIRSLPVGYGQNLFNNCLRDKPQKKVIGLIRRMKSCIFRRDTDIAWNWKAPAIDPVQWSVGRKQLNETSCGIWENIDICVINGEGTIHHNQLSALALIALALQAKENDKKVWLVNATIQEMDETLMELLLSACDYIVLREPLSYRWLSKLSFSVELAADPVFLLNIKRMSLDRAGRNCLYTPGVLTIYGNQCRTTPNNVLKQLRTIQNYGWEPTYLSVETDDNVVLESVRQLDIPIIELGTVNHENIGSLLQDYDLVVSGRYHVLIYACMAGVPIVPMQSNTWKIEGFLELIGCHGEPVRDMKGLNSWLNQGPYKTHHINIDELRKKAKKNCPAV